MSLSRPTCPKCLTPTDCEHVAWYSAAERTLFGVGWKCARCGERKLVVSPISPTHIGALTCLHCGAERSAADSSCGRCATSLEDVLPAAERELSNEALLERAREEFAIGTCRRGLTLANFVLQRAASEEVATIKAQFVEHLDAQQPFGPA